jgi:hypothetical protein
MASYGVQVFNEAGVQLVGFDNPTTIIDNVARIDGQIAYDPPIVTGFSVKFHDSLIKTYPQRSGVQRLVCIGRYSALSQLNARPYCKGWLVLEVG